MTFEQLQDYFAEIKFGPAFDSMNPKYKVINDQENGRYKFQFVMITENPETAEPIRHGVGATVDHSVTLTPDLLNRMAEHLFSAVMNNVVKYHVFREEEEEEVPERVYWGGPDARIDGITTPVDAEIPPGTEVKL